MKVDPQLLANLQQIINLEWALAQQYLLDWKNCKRYGLADLAEVLKTMHEQSEDHASGLVSALYFREGAPAIAAAPAAAHNTVAGIIADAFKAEQAIVARYAELTKQAFELNDIALFHYYQHISKWHCQGGNDYKGHLAMLQREAWQLKEFGETDYEEVKA